MNVLVAGQGSGSGSGGTICVRGIVTDQDPRPEGLPVTIRVRVLPGSLVPPLPPPDPRQPGDVDVTPVGQQWCAQNVPVSGSSSLGVPMTVIAWERTGSSGWSAPQSEWFNAGGPNPTDCCSGCGAAPTATSSAFQSWPPPPPPFPPDVTG
jgi:hypothetical protein